MSSYLGYYYVDTPAYIPMNLPSVYSMPAVPRPTAEEIAIYREFVRDYGLEDWEVTIVKEEPPRKRVNWLQEGF